ncbi:MAG TPA: choice-of-anchor P family protein [Actinocrinis sp.]|jgi:hypothetical protein|uniref:choice-of-anchor P family protein n=1 Tax=Actinocrinis sp. TaxID=1920516 RepID=UPI002DDD9D8B|nr:choice-of-anchor P family protein [Actinocrinis sp.]HEV3169251.1 choice-of-anchor P family protein [Actinocrinis sp.]
MSTRSRRWLAAGAAVLGGLLCAATPAQAALTSPQAEAYVVSANAFGSFLAVAPTPFSTYSPGGTQTLVGLTVGPFATSSTLTSTTAGDPTNGTASASATVEQLGVNLGPALSASLTGVNATCNATPSGATGNGIITAGSITALGLPALALTANALPNTVLGIPGVVTVTLNEQSTDANGVLTVNAVHIKVLSGNGADVIVGQAQCGGAPPVQATPMISSAVGAGAVAMAAVGGVVYLRRRNRGQQTEAV